MDVWRCLFYPSVLCFGAELGKCHRRLFVTWWCVVLTLCCAVHVSDVNVCVPVCHSECWCERLTAGSFCKPGLTHRSSRCCLWTPGGHQTQPGRSRCHAPCINMHAQARRYSRMHACHCTTHLTPEIAQHRCCGGCGCGGAFPHTLGCFGGRQALRYERARGPARLILSLVGELCEPLVLSFISHEPLTRFPS